MLTLPAPRMDLRIEQVEQRLGATQLGFQEAMLKQFQNLTDQMALLIKNQQPSHPPQIESGNHSSGFWCTQYQQHDHMLQFCKNRPNRNQRTNNNGPQQNPGGPNQNQNQGNNRGPLPRGQTNQNTEKETIFAEGIMS